MGKGAGETRPPRSVIYAMAINLFYGAILLAATTIAALVKTKLQGESLHANPYYIFVYMSFIYAAITLLIVLLLQSLIDKDPHVLDRFGAQAGNEAFFSKGYFASVINAVALSSIVGGTALFLLLMYGLSRFVAAPAG